MYLHKLYILTCTLLFSFPQLLSAQSSLSEAEIDSIYESAIIQIQTDKYYESLKQIQLLKKIGIENNSSTQVARAENLFYVAYQSMYAYDKAEGHLLEAIRLNTIAKDTQLLTQNYSSLAYHYMIMEDFSKYDKSLRKSRALNKNGNYTSKFYQYESEVNALYKQKKFDSLVLVAKSALNAIEKTDIERVTSRTYVNDKWPKVIKERFKITFEFYLAYGLIETRQDLALANQLLNKVKDQKLEKILWFSSRVFQEYYRINDYKAEYFVIQNIPNSDSISYYQKKAAFYFNKTTNFLENKTGANSNYLNLAIENEMQIERLDLLNANKEQESMFAQRLAALMAVLGLLFLIFIIYYRRANNQIKKINNTLDEKNTILRHLHIHRNKFLAVISHEIRTPMYALQELISNVSRDYGEEGNFEFALAKYSLINLRNSVDNSLQFSRLNFYKDSISIIDAPVDIKNLISELKSYYSPLLIINEVSLIVNNELQHNIYEFNRTKIAIVLNNLIKNAVELKQVTHVKLKVEDTPVSTYKAKIKFSVIDDGIGISEEMLAYVNKGEIILSDDNQNKDIKLGLILCNQILGLYNSKLVFESTELQNSISFELGLKPSTKLTQSSKKRPKNVGRKKILYVDDNRINLLITKQIIESLNHDCYIESSGQKAVKRVQVFDYDLILMDINMPNMDGFETSKSIYNINNNIPIVAYTALSEDEIHFNCKASKISEILTKPLDPDQFKHMLAKYFG